LIFIQRVFTLGLCPEGSVGRFVSGCCLASGLGAELTTDQRPLLTRSIQWSDAEVRLVGRETGL